MPETTAPTTRIPAVAPPPRGRLAPSPTGRLHLGNLCTFLLAQARALQTGAQLLLRIEDLDQPRVVPGAADAILRDLEWLEIAWSNEGVPDAPLLQSARHARHRDAFATLRHAHLAYPCACSRSELRRIASAPHGHELVYPGLCRPPDGAAAHPRVRDTDAAAWRMRVRGREAFTDGVHGDRIEDLERDHGDFVLLRRDGVFAYHFAVVVDDHDAGITEVVRGADLLAATARHNHLHRAFGWTPPATCHTPLLTAPDGERLSKRGLALNTDELRGAGWTPATLRGALATLLDPSLATDDLRISPADFARAIRFDQLPRDPVAVPDAWRLGPGFASR